jgi:two-component system response regulator PilR (NtrC family)
VRAAEAAAVARLGRVLVVDDEEVVQDVLSRLLTRGGYQPEIVSTGEEALVRLARERFDAVLLDLMLPGRDGMSVLRESLERYPDIPVLMMTAFSSVEGAVEAMKLGAFHYLPKPFKNEEVLNLVAQAIAQSRLREENVQLRKALLERHRFEKIVGRSRPMQELYRLVDQVAPSRSTVLIQGESGTGKELFAQALHQRSGRGNGPIVVVNCNSIPPDLLEANLFGHTRGAFTGAATARKGLFEAADGGSIFLDEISSIRMEIQTKLLRVMQEKEFIPIGSTEPVRVDVRIIAATNIDLKTLVERGDFREDLYYRLNVISLTLPPLRDRIEDVPILAEHFLHKFAAENGRAIERLTPEAMDRLVRYPWPGNVRQLENVIERAVVLCSGREIGLDLLPPDLRDHEPSSMGPAGPTASGELPQGLSFNEAVEAYERHLIESALKRLGGVQKRAAESLGLKPTTLNEKIKRLRIPS